MLPGTLRFRIVFLSPFEINCKQTSTERPNISEVGGGRQLWTPARVWLAVPQRAERWCLGTRAGSVVSWHNKPWLCAQFYFVLHFKIYVQLKFRAACRDCLTKGSSVLTTENEEEPRRGWRSVFVVALHRLSVAVALSNAILFVLSSFKITEMITESFQDPFQKMSSVLFPDPKC